MKSILTNTTLRAHSLIWETSCCCSISRINLQFFIYLKLIFAFYSCSQYWTTYGEEKKKTSFAFENIHTRLSVNTQCHIHRLIAFLFLVINDKHRHSYVIFYSINILTFYIPLFLFFYFFHCLLSLSVCTSRCEWGYTIKYPIKFFLYFFL